MIFESLGYRIGQLPLQTVIDGLPCGIKQPESIWRMLRDKARRLRSLRDGTPYPLEGSYSFLFQHDGN